MNRILYSLIAAMIGTVACTSDHSTTLSAGPNSEHIIGGDLINLTSSPIAKHVMALLIQKQIPDRKGNLHVKQFLCSAAIIADDLALTAAHCFESQFALSATALFGADLIAAPYEKRQIAAFSKNQDWNPNAKPYEFDVGDLALVRFSGGLPKGYSAAPILQDASVLVKGAVIKEAGYGTFVAISHEGDGILRDADVEIVNTEFGTSEILTDESHGKGICAGDSGGPAFIEVEGQFYLWGIASRQFFPTEIRPNPALPPITLCDRLTVHSNILAMATWIDEAKQNLHNQIARK